MSTSPGSSSSSIEHFNAKLESQSASASCESTPLMASVDRMNADNSDPSITNDDHESELQRYSEDSDDAAPIIAVRNEEDGLVRDGVVSSLSRMGYCHRYNRRWVPMVAVVLAFVATAALLEISGRYSFASSLSPPPSISVAGSSTENSAKIAALGAYLGSSLEGLSTAAVAADHPLCSKIGNDILQQRGGNAVDAAVATVLCLGMASPASSGLGGGSFLLIRSSKSHFEAKQQERERTNATLPAFVDARDNTTKENYPNFVTEVIDCREVAPEESTEDMYSGLPNSASMVGGLAVAVPGELRGLELAHARHGRLPWRDVVEPTIKLARDGVPVDRHTARFIDGFFQHWDNYFAGDEKANKAASGLRKYLSPNGSTYLREGELLRNLPLAETLEAIAEDGADALYKGAIAENLVEDVRASGGILTTNDMESYRAVLRTPISASVFGDMNYTLVGVPPPSSGGAVIIGIARFLSGYLKPFASDGLSFHRMVEGMRHAFAIRMSMGDPAFSANLTKGAVEDLTTTGYIESLRQMTRDDTVLPLSLYGGPKWAQLHDDEGKKEAVDAHEGDRRQRIRRRLALEQEVSERNSLDQSRRRLVRPFGYLEDSGTSHLSVLDGDGNAVAITTSINNIFGSEVYSETTGVLLGNTMDDFGAPLQTSNKYGLKPSEANFIAPGKRPLSSMSPTMLLRNGGGDSSPGNKWGDLVMVVGGSGGPKIINAVLQVLLNVLFRKMSVFNAMASPRVHDQLLYHGSVVTTTEKVTLDGVDDGKHNLAGPTLEVPETTKRALLNRHHKLLDIDYTGCVQAILVDHESNTLSAASDMRKDGSPAGY